jgi:two-component system, LytTR family, response regulator
MQQQQADHMPLKCVAIDDEPLAPELIREYVSRFPALKLVHTFDDAISAVELLRQTNQYARYPGH